MGLKTNKNFITTNAVENITSVPKKPEKKFADTRIGDTHNLIPSGLEPVFVHKKVGITFAFLIYPIQLQISDERVKGLWYVMQ